MVFRALLEIQNFENRRGKNIWRLCFQRAIVGQLSCGDSQLLLGLAWAQTANHGFRVSFASPGQLAIGLDNLFLNLWAVNPVSCATRLKLSVGVGSFSSPDPGTLPQRGVLAWESILVT